MVIVGWLAVVIIYLLIANHMYNQKHKDARQRVKKLQSRSYPSAENVCRPERAGIEKRKETDHMDTIYVFRERIQELYARYSRIIEKAGQFILAFAAFALINHQVGFLGALASPVAALGLAIICTFLPLFFTVIVATALILAHLGGGFAGHPAGYGSGVSCYVYFLSEADAEDVASGCF